MERIVIPGKATHSPVALTDLFLGAPMASRLLLGATLPGQILAAGAAGYYVGSAVRDRVARRNVRPIDFQDAFGVDVGTLEPMPESVRTAEMRELAGALSDDWTPERWPRERVAKEVNRCLMRYIAGITGQEVITSDAIRSFTIGRVVFPFALGACDAISGDVAIFKDTGLLEPHVITHEFAHRQGYLKELHAQALAFFALRVSGIPQFVQSARAERLHRHLAVRSEKDPAVFQQQLDALPLRAEVRDFFHRLRPADGAPNAMSKAMRKLYDARMRLTGQNGLSDYDRGFLDFLWTFKNSPDAKQPRHHAAV